MLNCSVYLLPQGGTDGVVTRTQAKPSGITALENRNNLRPLMKEIRLQVTTNSCSNRGSNFWYVRVRTSETPLLYESNEKLPKILRINFYRTLENNQRLVTIQLAYI